MRFCCYMGTILICAAAVAAAAAAAWGESICRAAASSVLQECGIALQRIWLVGPHFIKKTTSGKIQRAATRDVLLYIQQQQQQQQQLQQQGDSSNSILFFLDAEAMRAKSQIAAPAAATAIATAAAATAAAAARAGEPAEVPGVRDWLLQQLQQCLFRCMGIFPRPDASLHALGLDSLAVTEVAAAVQQQLLLPVTPQDMLQAETLREFAELLLQQKGHAAIATAAAAAAAADWRGGPQETPYEGIHSSSSSSNNNNNKSNSSSRVAAAARGLKASSLRRQNRPGVAVLRLLRRPQQQQQQQEPLLGITGAACRLPGGCNSPQQLWRHLMHGLLAVGNYPTNR